MKKVLFIIGGLGLTFGLALYIRSKIEPGFNVYMIQNANKIGKFRFSGIDNEFALGQNKGVKGRNGYSVEVKTVDSKSVVFNLYKNGAFIRELQKVNF